MATPVPSRATVAPSASPPHNYSARSAARLIQRPARAEQRRGEDEGRLSAGRADDRVVIFVLSPCVSLRLHRRRLCVHLPAIDAAAADRALLLLRTAATNPSETSTLVSPLLRLLLLLLVAEEGHRPL